MSDAVSIELIFGGINQDPKKNALSLAVEAACELEPNQVLSQFETLAFIHKRVMGGGYDDFEDALIAACDYDIPFAVVDFRDSDYGKYPTTIAVAGPGLDDYEVIEGDDPEEGRAYHRKLTEQKIADFSYECQTVFLEAAHEAGWVSLDEAEEIAVRWHLPELRPSAPVDATRVPAVL